MAEQTLTVRLRADGQGLTGTVRLSDRELKRLERQFDRTGREARRFGGHVDSAQRSLNRVGNTMNRVRALAAGAGAAFAGRAVVRAADTYANVRAQLELVGLEYKSVNQVAQQTFGTIEATSRVAFRLGAQTDLHAQKILNLTETINQSFAVSGATQQEASASIFQLTQGLAAGALRGEEFNSVMEQAPRLVRALTDHLGKTTGELREMAHAGQLTTEVIVEALTAQADAIAREFEKVPLTVQRAWTQLTNSFVEAVGESSEVRQVTQSLATGLATLARHLPTVIGYLAQLLQVALAYGAIRFLAPLLGSIATAAVSAGTAIQVLGARGAATYARLSLLQRGTGLFARALGLLGGPAGLAATAVVGLTAAYINQRRQLAELRKVTPETASAIETAMTTAGKGIVTSMNEVSAALSRTRQELRQTQAAIEEREERISRRAAQPLAGSQLLGGAPLLREGPEVEALREKVDDLTDSLGRLQEQARRLESIENLRISDIVDLGRQAWQEFNNELERSEREVPQVIDRVEGLTQKLRDQRLEQEKGRVALIELQRARDLEIAVTLHQREEINRVYDALIDEIRATQELEDAKDRANEARREAAEAARLEADAVDLARQILEDQQALMDPVAAQTREMTQLRDRLAVAEEEIQQRFGVTIDQLVNMRQVQDAASESADQLGEAGLQAGEQVSQGMSFAADEARDFASKFANLADSLSRAWGDWLTGGLDTFRDFTDAIRDIGRRFLSDMVSMFLRNRLILPITMALGGGAAAAGGLGPLGNAIAGSGGGIFGGVGNALFGGAGLFGSFGTGLGSLGTAIAENGLFGGIGSAFQGGLATIGNFFTGGGTSFSGLMAGIGQLAGPVAIAAFAAQAIDSLAGGRLFGTDYETTGQARQISFGAGGASGQLEIEQSRERSLFRGTQTRTLIEDLDADTQASIQAFFDQLTASVEQAAAQLGVEIPRLVEGTFREVLDAEGNVESTSATIAGRTYEGLSIEEFQQRVQAENLIAVVAQANEAAQTIADRWRDSAEELLEGAQLLLQVQQQIQAGNALLEGDNALTRIVDLVEELEGAGETLSQTYQRLVQATALYEDALDLMGQSFDGAREDLVRHAAAIAEAAGGIERATQLWQTFFSTFYSGAERAEGALARAQENAASELGDVGLAAGISREAFRAAFEQAMAQGLSAEATAEWLEASQALAQVLDLEDQLSDARREEARFYEDIALEVGRATGQLSELDIQLIDINRRIEDWVERAEDLGASEAQLAQIRSQGQVLIAQAIADWQAQRRDFLQGVQDEIDTFEASDFQLTLRDIARGWQDMIEEGQRLGFTMDQLGSVTELAQRRMQAAIEQLEGNIRDAVAELYGSPTDRALNQVEAMIERWETALTTGGSESFIVARRQLFGEGGLYAERDALLAQQRQRERFGLAQGLAQNLADLAGVRGVDDFASLASEFGFSLDALATDLGIDRNRLTAYLEDLQANSYTLADLTTGIDDVLDPQVTRIVDAILDGDGTGRGGLKPQPLDGATKPGAGDQEAVDVSFSNAGAVSLELPVRTHDREMLKAQQEAVAELRGVLKAVREGRAIGAAAEKIEAGLERVENAITRPGGSTKRGFRSG